jgi:competence protein ComEC
MGARLFLLFLIALSATIIFLSLVAIPVWLLALVVLAAVVVAVVMPLWRKEVLVVIIGCVCGVLRIVFPEPWLINSKTLDLITIFLKGWANQLNAVFQQIFPQPVSGFSQGIITGGQGVRFSNDFYEALRRTSTMHLIAVSGYNVSLISRYIQRFFVWLTIHRKLIWLFSLIGVWLFIVFTGVPSSAIRAGLMISLFIIAERFSRTGKAWRVLVYALAIMLVQNPQTVFDLGFQLSFLATTGIIAASSSSQINHESSGFKSLMKETLWAQAMVFPLIAYKFGTVSLFGLAANFIILPLMPLFMVLSAAPAIFGLVHLVFGKILAVAALPGLLIATKTIEWFGSWPHSSVSIPQFGWLILILYYMAMGFIVIRKISAPLRGANEL